MCFAPAETMPLSIHVLLCFLVLLIPASTFTLKTLKARPMRTGMSTVALDLHAKSQTHRNILILSHNVSQDVADGLFDVNNLLTGRIDVLARCVNSALWVSNGIRKDTSVFLMLFPHNITIEIQGDSVQNLNPDERTMALFLQRTLLVGGQGDENKHASEESSSPEQWNLAAEQRREVELLRLQETQRKRPVVTNPFKPGALPKSEKQAMRLARKYREAMVRRINRAGDDAPVGFLLHRNDTLETRLKAFSSVGNILMLHELGEPLVDALASMYLQKRDATITLILGDQIGYVASDEKLMAESDGLRQVSLGPISLLTSQCITITQHYLDTAKAARV
jgi:tRNA pseudouridine-54 N-methylase